jgi:chromate transport protein ChrA
MRNTRLRSVVQSALAPIAIALILASGVTLARAADDSLGAVLLTAVAAGAIAFTRFNPVWILLAAAAAGVAGSA